MAYTMAIIPIDLGGFLEVAPTITGRFESPPGTVADRAGPVTGLTSLSFPALPTPPAGAGSMHIVDTTTTGDLYRSGIQATWPAGASLRLYSLPTAGNTALPGVRTTFTNAQLLARLASLPGTVVPIPPLVTAGAAAATGFMFVPRSFVIGAVSMGSTPLTFNITGTLSFQQLMFNRTSRFTATVGVAVAPSGDAGNLARILAIRLTTALLDPGFITPMISLTIASLTPVIAQAFTGMLEEAVNRAIRTAVDDALAAAQPPQELTPTASICARRVTATSAGLSVQAVLSDLFGEPRVNRPVHPAVPVTAEALLISVAPDPQPDVMRQYLVTVRSATGSPVPGARVRLTNHDARGTVSTVTKTADGNGTATFDAALRARLQRRVITGRGGRETEMQFQPPVLRAELAPFSPAEIALLSAP